MGSSTGPRPDPKADDQGAYARRQRSARRIAAGTDQYNVLSAGAEIVFFEFPAAVKAEVVWG